MINKNIEKTEIETAFDENKDWFMMTAYKDGKELVLTIQNTDVLAFNVWSYLTKAKPAFDEIRIRVATDDEVREWTTDSPFDAERPGGEKI